MPELPEVETIKRQLQLVLLGQVIESVEVRRDKSWQGEVESVVGKGVVSVERKGKVLIVGLEANRQSIPGSAAIATQPQNLRLSSCYLLIHLKMTGQLIYEAISKTRKVKSTHRVVGGHPTADWIGELPSPHTRVIIRLHQSTLYFNDQRVFGWIRLVTRDKLQEIIHKFPPDIIDKKMTKDRFYRILQGSNRAIKLVVMDNTKIGGVGNIYANDGLWLAQIDPLKSAKQLSQTQSDQLWKSLRHVVNKGIKHGGATASDNKYVNSSGLGGKYQNFFLAYEQAGNQCQRQKCHGIIKKIKIGGRGTYYCPDCQH